MNLLNKMKMLTRVVCVTSTVIVSVFYISNVTAEETRLIKLGAEKLVRLNVESGAKVNVNVWDREDVEINYDDETQQLSNYIIDIDTDSSGIKISSKLKNSGNMQLTFDLKVPKKTQLCLVSNGGPIKVSGLIGGLSSCSSITNDNQGTVVIHSAGGSIHVDSAPQGAEIKTGGGEISIENAAKFVIADTGGGDINIETVKGSVKARTGAGDIKLKMFQNSEKTSDINLVSGLGDVWLYLPKGFSMNLNVEIGYTSDTSGAYKVDSYFPFTLSKSNKRTASGTPKQYLQGNILMNDGKHNVSIKATNGNVYIRKM